MRNTFYNIAVLALAAHVSLAQTAPGKARLKPGQTSTTPAAPTDFSLTYASRITAEGLRQDLSVLASDAYEGRETGKKGQKLAADYLAKAFAAAGRAGPVAGSDNPYLQHFDMSRAMLDAPASTQVVGGKTYRGNQDFYTFSSDDTFGQPTALQPAFIGYSVKEEQYIGLCRHARLQRQGRYPATERAADGARQVVTGGRWQAQPLRQHRYKRPASP